MILEKVLWSGERENVKMLSLHGDNLYIYIFLMVIMNCSKD